ncbi:MAG: right-handed parallel beta-helix repeat-containing protein, partial [Anaerolineae bacterium]|nr:right-handed parallel beta-helix repeat-containing protein [Anaerolineae bacterium]
MAKRVTVTLLCLIILVASLSAATAIPVQAETVIPGNYTVTTTETWGADGSPYMVQGSLSVASTGHLTLDPGVEVRIQAASVFEVKAGGTLTAEGTSSHPIAITAISETFIGLRLWSGAHASLAYCTVTSAGYGGFPAVDVQATDVTLDHCTIHDNTVSPYALKLSGAGLSPAITNTTIENNNGYAIYQSTIDMTPTYLNLTLSGNGTDGVVWNNGSLNRALTLDGSQINGSPFIALDSININSGGHMTLTAGSELLIPPVKGLWVQSGGALVTEGTQGSPATITARDPGSPFVGVIYLPGSSGSLAYCDIHGVGGSSYPAVDIQSSAIVLDHCTLHDNAGAGIKLMGAGLSPTIKNSAIQNNGGYAVYQTTIDMTPTYLNLTLSGNGTDGVVWNSSYLNRALTLDGQQIGGSPFIALDSININSGGHMTLTAGSEL